MSSYSANQWPWWYPNVILVFIISWQNFGSMITHDAKSDGGESVYIAKSAYKKMERVLTSRSVSMDTRLRLLTTGMLCLIFTALRMWELYNQQTGGGSFASNIHVVSPQNAEDFMDRHGLKHSRVMPCQHW
jgi:hypothetical protein